MDLYFDTQLGLIYMHDVTYEYTFFNPYDPWISEHNCTYINYTMVTDDIASFQFNCSVNEWYYGVLTLVLNFTPGCNYLLFTQQTVWYMTFKILFQMSALDRS